MIKSKNKRKIRTFYLLTLLVGLITTNIAFIATNQSLDNQIAKNKIDKIESLERIEDKLPRISAYSTMSEGTGKDINVTFHQSKIDEGTPLYNLNVSKPNNYTFTTDTPSIDSSFNSTISNIEVSNIFAPNKTIVVEDDAAPGVYESVHARYMSFEVPEGCNNGYLENVTVKLRCSVNGGYNEVDFHLLPSENVSGIPKPLGSPGAGNRIYTNLNVSTFLATEYKLTNLHRPIDVSSTFNNTYYLYMWVKNAMPPFIYSVTAADDEANDNDPEHYVLESDKSEVEIVVSGLTSIDFWLTVEIAPNANTPTPSQVGMTINGTNVEGAVAGAGTWTREKELSNFPNQLEYILNTTKWADVTCEINKITVNYTKTDQKAIADFSVTEGSPTVYWNVTFAESISFFDNTLDFLYINYTIPTSWDNITVWKGSTQKKDNITRDLGNGYEEIQIFNADNDQNWYLNATSVNLFSEIKTYVNGNPTGGTALYTKDIEINATFKSNIASDDGNLNVTIYNYVGPNTQNYTNVKQNFIGGIELNFTVWDVSDWVQQYGRFRIQTLWNNASDVGFGEGTITIIGKTGLVLLNETGQEFMDNERFNITVFYIDTGKQNSGIAGAKIYNNSQEITSPEFNATAGYYYLEVNTTFYPYGQNIITIGANKTYYENQTRQFDFFKVQGTQILPTKPNNFFERESVYRNENVSFTFNYTTLDGLGLDGATWKEIDAYDFDAFFTRDGDGNYTVELNTSQVINGGNFKYKFNITIFGNETQVITLNITVLLPNVVIKWITDIGDIDVPKGNAVILRFDVNASVETKYIVDLSSENVSINEWPANLPWNRGDYNWKLTNYGNGTYELNISTFGLSDAVYQIKLNITYVASNPGPYNSSIKIITFTYGTPSPNPPPPAGDGGDDDDDGGTTVVTGIDPLWIIILAIVGGLSLTSYTIYKKVVVPKKREKERILREVTTVFDDAINVEHILVIYKGTGTCLFFKSYGMEEIDPELISGFLTAVSSFGREMDSQEALNEIQYGDKMLLLADGEYVRVALVLDKQASIFLRQNLKEFIKTFEISYGENLPGWRGQIDVFRDSGELVDEKLQTSIILPHEIQYDLGKVKSLKVAHSKDVLRVAQKLIEGSERKFFFIATLLTEAIERTGKDKAEVFMGVKELREKRLLSPIQISAVEAPRVSQQELNMIRQQVCTIPEISEEEINKLVNDLAGMSPAEREAYLASCREQEEIVSAPIVSKAGTKVIDTIKSAKNEINNLKKKAKIQIKEKELQSAIESYRNAAVIATNWDLRKEIGQLEDTIRLTRIIRLKGMKKQLEIDAKKAVKKKDYATAAEKYGQASQAASEMFKLGEEIGTEQKRLRTLSKKYEKLI